MNNPIGDDGRRESVGPEVEERSYTVDEQRRFLLELQELGYSSRLPSQLVDEISIQSRRFEGYLAHSALDESRLGIPLRIILSIVKQLRGHFLIGLEVI